MSAIGGLLRFDSKPVERADLERMADALRMYGPDRTDIAIAPRIRLLHALMRMTPEDRFDRQPLRGPSGAVISADLRIDNRDDVLARLGMSPQEALAWPDAPARRARCLGKIRQRIVADVDGPFAIAIWSPRDATLTLARDHLGLNVVMWHRRQAFLAFATMPKACSPCPRSARTQR